MRSVPILVLVAAAASAAAAGPEPDPPPGDGVEVVDKSRPAHEVYRNIRIFTRDMVTAAFLDRLMTEFNRDLGVSCAHCHDPAAWHEDDLGPRKRLARETISPMWKVVSDVNTTYFPGQGGPVRCWTCHRGSPAPERVPPRAAGLPPAGKPDPFLSIEPKNLEVLGHLDRAALGRTMRSFAASLGLRCVDCHIEGNWASDERALKRKAREMLVMTAAIDRKHFEPGRGPTCWTCHRGALEVPHENGSVAHP